MTSALRLVVYTFAAFGLSYVIGNAVISKSLREAVFGDGKNGWRLFLVTLAECPACTGFWIGLGIGVLFGDFVGLGVGALGRLACGFVLALYTTAVNYLLGRATGWIRE